MAEYQLTRRMLIAAATSFSAEVLISGDVDAGDMVIKITQVEDNPPVRPPVNPPEPEPEPPPVGGGGEESWNPPSYLRTDTRPEQIPNAPRPAYLVPYTDPVFKTKITRITGDPGSAIRNISGARWGDQARHHYSNDQAWNCDQSMIYLDTNAGSGAAGAGSLFLDGETYEPLFAAKNTPSDPDIRWHATDPDLLSFVSGSKLGTWNPKTGEQKIIRNFGGEYSDMKFGPWEGSFSEDGDMVVISCQKNRDVTGFAYKISTDDKSPDISASSVGSGMDSVRISSKGSYMIWNFSPDKVIVTDLKGAKVTTFPNNYISHFDVITDGDGDEVIVGRVNSGSVGQGQDGLISKYRLRDGKRTGLSRGGWCSHTSARGQKTHRWSVSDALLEGANYPPYNGELIMCDLDGSAVYRLCHTHTSRTVDYVAQTQATHAPDSGRAIFASVWGGGGTVPRPVGCYVVDFRT